MAAGPTTQLADVIVPEIFTPYVQQLTEQKSRLIQSRVVARDPFIDQLLAGGGLTFNVPSFKDLDNDTDRIANDTTGGHFTGAANPDPLKTGTSLEIAVRLSRNNSWSSMDLTSALAGKDPMQSIGERVGYYWTRRMQAVFVATMTGVFNDNEAAPSGSEHTQNDLTVDVSGASYLAGVTDFSAEAFIDACTTLGDSAEDVVCVMVHSVVFSRMQKNNLIDFIPDSTGQIKIPTFLGREVIVDDSMPVSSGVYESWLFGAGALRLGVGTPKVPTETQRIPGGGNGSGQDVLYSRAEWCLHPNGHKFAVASPASGGPSNASTSGNLAHADSWARVFPERKQIKIARLITREA